MNNPKSEDVKKVIDSFKSVLHMATRPNHLYMSETTVVGHSHECGTVHCHAGWYGVAMIEKGEYLKDVYGRIGFSVAGNKLAEDLGFNDRDELAIWARHNPKIWGNVHGGAMFVLESAFESPERNLGAENLQHIIDHWSEVYDRLVALEEKDRKDITSELAILPVDETLDTIKTQVYETVY